YHAALAPGAAHRRGDGGLRPPPPERGERREGDGPLHPSRAPARASPLTRRPAAREHDRAPRLAGRVRRPPAPRERRRRAAGLPRDRNGAAAALVAGTASRVGRGRGHRRAGGRDARRAAARAAASRCAPGRRPGGARGARGAPNLHGAANPRAGATQRRGNHEAGARPTGGGACGRGVVLSVDGVPVGADAAFLDRAWLGRAHILWRDFESLGRTFGVETRGPQVARLQRLLARVGAYGGAATGVFDATTADAVL